MLAERGPIRRYESAEEARLDQNFECYERGFDTDRMRRFLEQFPRPKYRDTKPGLYRFHAFEEAEKFDLAEIIRGSVLSR